MELQAKVEPALRKVGQTGNVVMTDLARQQRQANDAASLLGRTLGVQLPRQLEGFLARSRTIGPILAGAFNASVVLSFGAAAVTALTRIPGLVEDIREHFTHAKADAEVLAKNYAALHTATVALGDAQRNYNEQLRLFGKEGAARAREQLSVREADLEFLQFQQAQYEEHLQQLNLISKQRNNLFDIPTEAAKAAQKEFDELLPKYQEHNTRVLEARTAVLALREGFNRAYGKETQSQIEEATGRLRDQELQMYDLLSVSAAAGRELAEMQRGADTAWQREHDESAQMYERWDEEMEQVPEKHREVAETVVRDWAAARDRMADQFVSLFDDISSGSIGRTFQNAFKRLVAGMVADWVLGVRQMSSSAAGGFGGSSAAAGGGGGAGGVRGILGSIFGGGGSSGGGLAGTPPFMPAAAAGAIDMNGGALFSNNQAAAMMGLPLSAGGAITTSTAMPAGASVSGPGGGAARGLSGILSNFGGIGALLGTGGLAAASAIGFGSPLRGAISGAAGAFAAGGILSTMLPFSAIGLAMPLLLPAIGIGAGIGALISALGNSKRARQRHELHLSMFRDLQTLEDQYKFFGIDYGSARSTLEQVCAQYVDSIGKLGGKRGHFVDPHVDSEIAKINQIEAERQRRAALQFGPAMFHAGGVVEYGMSRRSRYHSGGEVEATLLEGEGVVNRRGMGKLGREGLNAINSAGPSPGPGGDGGWSNSGITINGPLIQARTIDERWLRSGGIDQIRSELARAFREGRR